MTHATTHVMKGPQLLVGHTERKNTRTVIVYDGIDFRPRCVDRGVNKSLKVGLAVVITDRRSIRA
jgi:hypothetical protein